MLKNCLTIHEILKKRQKFFSLRKPVKFQIHPSLIQLIKPRIKLVVRSQNIRHVQRQGNGLQAIPTERRWERLYLDLWSRHSRPGTLPLGPRAPQQSEHRARGQLLQCELHRAPPRHFSQFHRLAARFHRSAARGDGRRSRPIFGLEPTGRDLREERQGSGWHQCHRGTGYRRHWQLRGGDVVVTK